MRRTFFTVRGGRGARSNPPSEPPSSSTTSASSSITTAPPSPGDSQNIASITRTETNKNPVGDHDARSMGRSNNPESEFLVSIREEYPVHPDDLQALLCPDIPQHHTGYYDNNNNNTSSTFLPELSYSSFSALSLDDDEDTSHQHWDTRPRSTPPLVVRSSSRSGPVIPPTQVYYDKNKKDTNEVDMRMGSTQSTQYATEKRKIFQKIEVAPGVNLRLRGATETWEAIQRDFYGPASCFACETMIFCIDDADYVLCPHCRVVNPYESICNTRGLRSGGVGLGFTMEQLAQWQDEMRRGDNNASGATTERDVRR